VIEDLEDRALLTGFNVTQLTSSPMDSVTEREQPSVSNDGRFVVFSSTADHTGQNSDGGSEVFLVDTTTGLISQLTDGEFDPDGGAQSSVSSFSPVISGDGTHIAFLSVSVEVVTHPATGEDLLAAATDLLVHEIAGTTTKKTNLGTVTAPSISDDGSRIVFYAQAGESDNIFTGLFLSSGSGVSLISDQVLRPVPVPTFNPIPTISRPGTISGDGSRAVFLSTFDITGDNPDHELQIFSASTSGGAIEQVTTDGIDSSTTFTADPTWLSTSTDGSLVVVSMQTTYLDGSGEEFTARGVVQFDTTTDEMAVLTKGADGRLLPRLNHVLSSQSIVSATASADGSRVAFLHNGSQTGTTGDFGFALSYLNSEINESVRILPREIASAVGSSQVLNAVISGDGQHIVFVSRTYDEVGVVGADSLDGSLELFIATLATDVDVTGFEGLDATSNLRLGYTVVDTREGDEDLTFQFHTSTSGLLGTLTITVDAITSSGGLIRLVGESAAAALQPGDHILEFDASLVTGLSEALEDDTVEQLSAQFDRLVEVAGAAPYLDVLPVAQAPFRGFFQATGSDVTVVRTGPDSDGASVTHGAGGTLDLQIDYDTADGPESKMTNVDLSGNPAASILIVGSDSGEFIHVESSVTIDTVIRALDGINLVAGGAGNDDILGGDNLDVLIGEGFGLSASDLRAFLDALSTVTQGEVQLASIALAAVGAGSDTINGGAGFDVLMGGPGGDQIFSGTGGGLLLGDSLRAEVALNANLAPLLNSGSFSAAKDALGDILTFTAGITLDGDGNDTIYGGSGVDLIIAGDGDDTVEALDPEAAAQTGTAGVVDVIFGNGGNDDINDRRASFTIAFGGTGDDLLIGGNSASFLVGNGGDDALIGGLGVDVLIGDTLDFDGHSNVGAALSGFSDGNLSLGFEVQPADVGQAGDDVLVGDAGFDFLVGGSGNDILEAGSGAAILFGDDFRLSASFGLNLADVKATDDGEAEATTRQKSGGFLSKALSLVSANVDFELRGSGDDQIIGSHGSVGVDLAFGGLGNDEMFTGGGVVDVLFGNDGDDTLKGGGAFTRLAQRASGFLVPDTVLLRDLADQRRNGSLLRITHLPDSSFSLMVGGLGSDTLMATPREIASVNDPIGSVLIGDSFQFQGFPATPADLFDIQFNDSLPTFFGIQGGFTQVGDGDDVLEGAFSGLNLLIAGNGNDSVTGQGSFDILLGDSLNLGIDVSTTIDYSALSLDNTDEENFAAIDTSFELPGLAGDGNDTIQGGAGITLAIGGGGADTIQDTGGVVDLLFGNDGNDTISGGSGFNLIVGGEDDNTGSPGDGVRVGDTLNGGVDGINVLLGDTFQFAVAGLFSLNDLRDGDINTKVGLIPAGQGDDIINGGAGLDLIIGGSGDDLITGGAGTNVILGDALEISADPYRFSTNFFNAGKSLIFGDPNAALNSALAALGLLGTGNDSIFGGANTDIILGGNGNDQLFGLGNGLSEFDFMVGGFGDDTVNGQAGDDVVFGGPGDDELRGGDGNDHMESEGGADRFFGEGGNDSIFGGAGNDSLYGGDGDDALFGEDENDLLDGGPGNNTIDDTLGSNTIVNSPGDGSSRTIVGFQSFGDGFGGLPPNIQQQYGSFGKSVANIGDLDGDGIDDIAVGDQQAVHIVLLNADGTAKGHTKIADGEGGLPEEVLNNRIDQFDGTVYEDFGASVAGVGDRNGDGIPDLAVGTPLFSEEGLPGEVYILHLDTDGTVKSHSVIGNGVGGLMQGAIDGDTTFGYSLAALDDLDGDGVDDLAVGTRAFGANSEIHVLLLNADGSVKTHTRIADGAGGLPMGSLTGFDQFGGSIISLGDLDGDGVTDLAVGSPEEANAPGNGAGAVHILFLNSDGTVKQNGKISDGVGGLPSGTVDEFHRFGHALSTLPDRDGDGVIDLVVTARGDGPGSVYILSLNTDGTVKSTFRIADNEPGIPDGAAERFYGKSVAAIGDINGDGAVDMVVGGLEGEIIPNQVTVLFLAPPVSYSASISLQDEGRSLELAAESTELVLRDAAGDELVRLNQFGLTALRITGSAGDDVVTVLDTGTPVDTAIAFTGGDGNDRFDASLATGSVNLTGNGGNDVLIGGVGNDTLNGGSGKDEVIGNAGDDLVQGQGSTGDTLDGGDGNDTLNGGSGNDLIRESFTGDATLTNSLMTGRGTDTIISAERAMFTGSGAAQVFDLSTFFFAGLTSTILDGGGGDDTILATSGGDIISGAGGSDLIDAGGGDDRVFGGSGADTIAGGNGNDFIKGLGGSGDQLIGGAGNDTLNGGRGVDRLIESGDADFTVTNSSMTGNGTDVLLALEIAEINAGNSDNLIDVSAFLGFRGFVQVRAFGGNDTILGSAGPDVLNGGDGNDSLVGGEGDDLLNGDAGNDILQGKEGDDTLNGGDDNDGLSGFSGNDVLNGERGFDRLFGGNGNDTLTGGNARDTLFGGAGNDSLAGNDGDDTLVGGTGNNDASAGDVFDGLASEIDEAFMLDTPAWVDQV